MNTISPVMLSAVLASVLMLGCASQANNTGDLMGETGESSIAVKGIPGGIDTRVTQLKATVKAIDYKTRQVTLEDEQGRQKTLTVGPEAVNFNQVEKGDTVNIAYVEELVVFLKEKGAPSHSGVAALAGRAPEGSKPQAVIAETVELTAVVTDVDLDNHTATLKFPSGVTRVVPVRADVALSKDQVGREMVFQSTEAMVLSVEPAN